ncbi:chemotaxis protein CheX [Desulfuribacillus alkaliarsenatis]|uniref:Chemotaxis protein CheC n=1 Tax=Desulfuribacillus alkaliarsenatis TaxID=766136 RepID=A0A1E5G189_9FIRM|nr:chemotaxis protein CheX [Desulfuribacillus alkaliarsenatis]OEF96590.1 chemotaxis protein CheC [Desulfuribacillus alkaliarsenatis]
MKVEYINPFYMATKDVFQLMLDLPVEKGEMSVVEEMISSKEANVTLGVTGDLRGSILFSFPKQMTLDMVEIMCGMKMDDIDSFVSSALGEIANIVGGNAVTNLTSSNYVCDIVPPQIFVGEYKSLSMASQKALKVTMKTSIGAFDVHIVLKEK